MKNNKGFTLVEIIVVLVILAILAAATIPSMLGFVNDAKQKSMTAEVRAVYVAAQAYATEQYAMGTITDNTELQNKINGDLSQTSHPLYSMLQGDAAGTISGVVVDAGKVKELKYKQTADATIEATFKNGEGITYASPAAGGGETSTEPSTSTSAE